MPLRSAQVSASSAGNAAAAPWPLGWRRQRAAAGRGRSQPTRLRGLCSGQASVPEAAAVVREEEAPFVVAGAAGSITGAPMDSSPQLAPAWQLGAALVDIDMKGQQPSEAPLPTLSCKPERQMASVDSNEGSNGSSSSAGLPAEASHGSTSSSSSDGSSGSGTERRAGSGMAMCGPPVKAAGQWFDSLLDLRFHMRVLQRQLLGDADEVEVPRGTAQFDLIQAVFRRHPNYSQKVREPISSFYVVRNPVVAGIEFQYVDARGKEARTDFSLLKCTKTRPTAKRNLLHEACAAAVESQLAEAKAAGQVGPTGGLQCGRCSSEFKVEPFYTGRPLSKLVQAYTQQAAPAVPPSKFVRVSGSQQAAFRRHAESDVAWQQGWQEYHQQHARLELLCKHCQCQVKQRAAAQRRDEQQRRRQQQQQKQGKQSARQQAAQPQDGQQQSSAQLEQVTEA